MENKKQLQEHLKVLQDKLAELVAKRAEMLKVNQEAKKYRQFGDELVNVDPAMASKYYAKADQLEAADADRLMALNGSTGKIPQDAKLLIDLINKKSNVQYNSNMFANATDEKKASLAAQLQKEIAPLREKLASMYDGKYLPYVSAVGGADASPIPVPLTEEEKRVKAALAAQALKDSKDGKDPASNDVLAGTKSFSEASKAISAMSLPKYSNGKDAVNWIAKVNSMINSNAGLKNDEKPALRKIAEDRLKTLGKVPVAKTHPKNSNKEVLKTIIPDISEVVKLTEISKLNPKVAGDLLLLAKVKSRGIANEAYMSDDVTLSNTGVKQAIDALLDVRTIPLQDGINFKADQQKRFNQLLSTAKEYIEANKLDLSESTYKYYTNLLNKQKWSNVGVAKMSPFSPKSKKSTVKPTESVAPKPSRSAYGSREEWMAAYKKWSGK